MELGQTTPYSISEPRVDFQKKEFEQLLFQKGREVLYEKSLQCPCKSRAVNQQSNCKNCGGTGWLFYNPTKTRFVVTGVSVTNDYKPWSEESRGMVNISCPDSQELCYMDKITLLNSNSIFQEVLFFIRDVANSNYYAYSTYPVKKVLYGGRFVSTSVKLTKLDNASFTTPNKNILLLPLTLGTSQELEVAVTLRYYYAPVYYVVEMKRETMESFRLESGKEKLQYLPLSAMARRGHYVLNTPNLDSERVLDNSFVEDSNNCTILDNCQ